MHAKRITKLIITWDNEWNPKGRWCETLSKASAWKRFCKNASIFLFPPCSGHNQRSTHESHNWTTWALQSVHRPHESPRWAPTGKGYRRNAKRWLPDKLYCPAVANNSCCVLKPALVCMLLDTVTLFAWVSSVTTWAWPRWEAFSVLTLAPLLAFCPSCA